jgi:hypothetical protein
MYTYFIISFNFHLIKSKIETSNLTKVCILVCITGVSFIILTKPVSPYYELNKESLQNQDILLNKYHMLQTAHMIK